MSDVPRTIKKAAILWCCGDKRHEVQEIWENEAQRPFETSEDTYPTMQN